MWGQWGCLHMLKLLHTRDSLVGLEVFIYNIVNILKTWQLLLLFHLFQLLYYIIHKLKHTCLKTRLDLVLMALDILLHFNLKSLWMTQRLVPSVHTVIRLRDHKLFLALVLLTRYTKQCRPDVTVQHSELFSHSLKTEAADSQQAQVH